MTDVTDMLTDEQVLDSRVQSYDAMTATTDDDDDIRSVVESLAPLPTSHQLAMRLGLAAEDLQIKKASFFGADDDDDDFEDGTFLFFARVTLYVLYVFMPRHACLMTRIP